MSADHALVAMIACDKAGHMFQIFSAYPSWLDIVVSWCTARKYDGLRFSRF